MRKGFPWSPTPEEAQEINVRTAFATQHIYWERALAMIEYVDMWQRQAIARLVERKGGNLFISDENRAKVAGILWV